jgi:acyl-CoA hydrolase
MNKPYKTVASSNITISELMLPPHTNFSGKIHGGYILSLLDQVAFASASKFQLLSQPPWIQWTSESHRSRRTSNNESQCKLCWNSSMIIGIRVESENIKREQLNIVIPPISQWFQKTKMETKSPRPYSSI